jgi:hypothetical protein
LGSSALSAAARADDLLLCSGGHGMPACISINKNQRVVLNRQNSSIDVAFATLRLEGLAFSTAPFLRVGTGLRHGFRAGFR